DRESQAAGHVPGRARVGLEVGEDVELVGTRLQIDGPGRLGARDERHALDLTTSTPERLHGDGPDADLLVGALAPARVHDLGPDECESNLVASRNTCDRLRVNGPRVAARPLPFARVGI